MDVRGPAESHDPNNNSVSQVRRELLRYESADEASSSHRPKSQFIEHASAPEINRLAQQLKALPEVREELVTQVVAKLRDGHYSTRKSAEKTAEAILRTLSRE
jgi:hypothetical protein